jgi:virulence-associated protein VagC
MFHASMHVDLPSELPPPTPVRSLVRWLLGIVPKPDARFEKLISCALTALEGTLRALADAGFDDIISILVDGKPIYVDVENKLNDLEEALEGVARCEAIRQGFSVLRLTASSVSSRDGDAEAVHVLADVRLRARVLTGEEEIDITLSGRAVDLAIRPSEQPREYAERVRAWVHHATALDTALATFDALTDRLAASFDRVVLGARARRDPTSVRVIVPGLRQVARMRYLTFGPSFREVVYQALPAHERTGPYDDPFYHHLYSPYADLQSWIVAGEVLDGCWPRSDVELVAPNGTRIATGDRAQAVRPEDLEVARHAVRVDEQGQLVIDSSIARVGSLDPAERGSPHTPGWAGGSWGEGTDGGGELGG